MQLNLNAPYTNRTSYGIAAINILLALERNGCNVAAHPIGHNVDYFPHQRMEPALIRGKEEFNIDDPSIRIYHQFALAEHVGRKLNIGFPIFECNKFTKQEKANLNSCDIVLCCSKWALDVLHDAKLYNTGMLVPLGVDTTVFTQKIKTSSESEPYRFFFPGKFEYRKGFDVVMSVFDRVFTENDNIEIIFLPFNPFIREQNEEWAKFLMQSKLASKVKILNRLETHEQVAEIYQNVDCVVSFSRAEGWNMPLLEGLATGCQVVATNYSGQTEFLTSSNSILIDVEDKELMIDGVFFNGEAGGEWLCLKNINPLCEAIASVYERGKTINYAGITTAKDFTWDNTAKYIMNIVDSSYF